MDESRVIIVTGADAASIIRRVTPVLAMPVIDADPMAALRRTAMRILGDDPDPDPRTIVIVPWTTWWTRSHAPGNEAEMTALADSIAGAEADLIPNGIDPPSRLACAIRIANDTGSRVDVDAVIRAAGGLAAGVLAAGIRIPHEHPLATVGRARGLGSDDSVDAVLAMELTSPWRRWSDESVATARKILRDGVETGSTDWARVMRTVAASAAGGDLLIIRLDEDSEMGPDYGVIGSADARIVAGECSRPWILGGDPPARLGDGLMTVSSHARDGVFKTTGGTEVSWPFEEDRTIITLE